MPRGAWWAAIYGVTQSRTWLKQLSSSSSSIHIYIYIYIYAYVYVIIYIYIYTYGFPAGSAGKESACNVGNPSSIPGLGRIPGEGNGYPLQYSGLKNSMDCIIHGVAKSELWLSDFHFNLYLLHLCNISSWGLTKDAVYVIIYLTYHPEIYFRAGFQHYPISLLFYIVSWKDLE